MMPSNRAVAPLVAVEVPAGRSGATVVARALTLAAQGAQSSVLIPGYAPEPMRRRLLELLDATPMDGWSETAVCVPTSGSTGTPRAVVMPWHTLAAATAARDEALGGRGAWLVAVPPATAGGVVALARALQADTAFEAWAGIGGAARFSAATFAEDAERLLARAETAAVPARVTVVSNQVARLIADPIGRAALQRFETVLVGGGPMSAQLRGAAADEGIRVVHTYGMTETCGGFAYDGVPTPGCEVRVSDAGEILVRGSCVAAGYLDAPLPTTDGWLRTGDRGVWDGTRLSVDGRIDDVVTVRGANVDLAAVAAVIAEIPHVQQSAVVAVEDPDGGHRLKVFVVGHIDTQGLRSAVHESLGAAAVPEVVIVDELPSNPGGKADTQQLQEDSR